MEDISVKLLIEILEKRDEAKNYMEKYRKEYKRKDFYYDNQHKFKKSKHKYSRRKDWD